MSERYPRGLDPELAAFLEEHTRIAPDGCWEWQRCLDGFGYGLARWSGKVHRAHRLAFKLVHGYFTPRGIVVRHKCDNPRCCNPDHLTEGTRADNNKDRDRRGRHVSLKGERNGNATLTAEQVLEIRSSAETSAALSRRMGVGYGAVTLARRGRSWKHVGGTLGGGPRGNIVLTPQQVAAIRASEDTTASLARRLGVSETTVRDVRKGRTWKLAADELA